MQNPLRSEAEAFRFLGVVIGGAIVIVVAAYINLWVGVAAALLVIGGVVVWMMRSGPRAAPAPKLTSSTPGGSRLLVIAPPGTSAVAGLLRDGATEVLVVVPALASTVESLTGAVDDRRAEAAATAEALAGELTRSGLRASGVVGADDPVQAADDALRTFGADEIVFVAADEALLGHARERFAVPVSRA